MMKNYPQYTLLLFFVMICLSASSQINQLPVSFKAGKMITGNNIVSKKFIKGDLQNALYKGNYYGIIQFTKLPDEAVKQELKAAGLTLGDYIPGNAFYATIGADFDFDSAGNYQVSSINTLPAFYKIDPALQAIKSWPGEKLLVLGFYPSVSQEELVQKLKEAGASITHSKFMLKNAILVYANDNAIDQLAALPFIRFVSPQAIESKPLNYKGVALHGVSGLLSVSGKNLSGKGVTVGVGDNSEIVTPHIDFTDRVINRVSFPLSFHGIHVSGTVAGGGLLDPKYNGMAPRATIVSQYLSDIITNTPVYAADNGMIATNNSYTAAEDSCAGNGGYDILSNYTDLQMNSLPEVLHVFSAGNDGIYTCNPYPAAFATIKTGYQCAKNVLTVGAMNQADYTIANFSSRGPVNDGRLKPEIVASGVSVISTRQNNTYGGNSGTSMSGPMVAGAVTLLYEQYKKLNGNSNPKASLIKALLCNTAEDLGNPGPDYTFGFGNMNAGKAADALINNQFFVSTTAPVTQTIAIPAGVRRLKVMLYWQDAAAAINASSTLVNDLDLTVTSPSAATFLPLILNSAAANVNSNATQGADHVNNIEQVVIDNPAAGNYGLNVSAFSVPAGPQEYVITYQFDMNGVTIDYPFGGEKLVPGEVETIRWTAEGDNANSFTLEYFDGTSWTVVNNNIAATARSFNWTVPATVSDNYRIKVSRNASAYIGQSSSDFSVIGQPFVTTSIPCEGFAQLNWGAIAGATSYDIWQLKADTMAVVGNTNSLSYLISGLNSATTYWFGVSAKNGSIIGRRSNSKSALPASGTCSLNMFDNNFKAVFLDAPVSGRQFTSSALTAAEQIKFTIKNLDDAASSGSYDLYYKINNNAAIMEISTAVVTALGTYQYTFSTTADLSAVGSYTIKTWVKRPGDTQVLDDTVSVTIKNLANAAITLPFTDGFESTDQKDYRSNTIGLDGDDRLDFKTNSTKGQARTFVNTGFAHAGNRAITLDQFPYSATLNTDSLLITCNLVGYNSGNQLRLDFYYKNHGADNNPNNKVWIRGTDTSPWIEAYNLVANQSGLGLYKHAVININDVLDTVLPVQPVTSSFQVKFGQQGNTSANVPDPILDQDDGYTFDDVSIKEASNDIGIYKITAPAISGCGINGSQVISVQVKNYSGATLANVPVSYRVNGGSVVTENISSLPAGITNYNFTAPFSFTLNTDYSFDFWVHHVSDNYLENDSILNYKFHTSPVVNTFPYLEGFESNDGSFFVNGSNSSWQWGTPSKTLISKAANGTKAWVTSLTGSYKSNELSYLYSPCFDLSSLTQPVLSFSHIFELEDAIPADYTWIEYSDDGGVTWSRLGTNGAGTNWFNDPTLKKQWRTSLTTWHVASSDIPTRGTNVRFRFVMASDMAINYEGVGIDDIHIFDKALIYNSVPVTGITQNVSGNNWIHFTSGGNRVVSINANNNNMGNTTVDAYPFTGTVRTRNSQYYLNRNIVIRPQMQPAADVSVRFYFTDAEAKSLLAATGCAGCTKPKDPYALGVTKYSGTAIQENGTLDDNYGGIYSFIIPDNTAIIPYDNGYYAEFPVNSFSEFWLNDGGIGAIHPLPISLLSFNAIKKQSSVLLQWNTVNEINTRSFIIERSTDGLNYTDVGTIAAYNWQAASGYAFTDNQPVSGNNFYRLKIIYTDGSSQFSDVKKIIFNGKVELFTVYPNPVTAGYIYIENEGIADEAVLFDAGGRTIRKFLLIGGKNKLNLSGISKGVYQLQLKSAGQFLNHKIIIQ